MLQFTAIALLLAGFSLQGTNAAENSSFYSKLEGVIKLGNLSISFSPKSTDHNIKDSDVLGVKLEETNPDGSANKSAKLFITRNKHKTEHKEGDWCYFQSFKIIGGGAPYDSFSRSCPKPRGKSEEAVLSELLGDFFQNVYKFINRKLNFRRTWSEITGVESEEEAAKKALKVGIGKKQKPPGN